MNSNGLTFGIYPLGVAGTPVGLAVGPNDDYEKIQLALRDLKGSAKQLLPRNYIVYTGRESERKWLSIIESYDKAGLLGDLVVGCMQEPDLPLDDWLDFVKKIIGQFGEKIDSLQITNEPNLTFMDGSKPHVFEALVKGVIAAKKEVRKLGINLKIGFGSVPSGPKTIPQFWEKLEELGGKDFIDSVDYAAHNFYVDVFEEPLDLEEIKASTEKVLRQFREVDLKAGGISHSVSIRIGENGWPTGKNPFSNVDRPDEKQAEVLKTIVETVYKLKDELNITHYELFGLRDADSDKEDLFHQFGIMTSSYEPKPAYNTIKRIIEKYSE
ncbi:hypothetical protein [Metabacillus sp. RGM 3146]|uniref:hypothetical protein n=1 Tax=Metabacillus sp. RGM 3146 TaxID=3401092 RepID=UPI003B9D1710